MDKIIYPFLIKIVGSASELVKFMPLVALLSFLLSVCLGTIISIVFEIIVKTGHSLFYKGQTNR